MLNLQTIIMKIPPPKAHVPLHEVCARREREKEEWIESAKHILIQIQLRDNLEKIVVLRDYDDNERQFLIKPKSSFDF